MFGLSKAERLDSLRKSLQRVKAEAKHAYGKKEESEEMAFYGLAELARREGVSAQEASKKQEGLQILSEVVLNRQWAFYLNEKAIQIQAKITELEDKGYRSNFYSKEYWFQKVVMPSGGDIVIDQIEPICSNLISEVDDYLN